MGNVIVGEVHWWQMLLMSVVPVATIVGGGLKYINGVIASEARCREDSVKVLTDKLITEVETIEEKIEHKNNNSDAKFDAVTRTLEKMSDKIDRLNTDNVLINEKIRTQEAQAREFKNEVKESLHALTTNMDVRLKEIASTQQSHFEQLATSIREIRDVRQRG